MTEEPETASDRSLKEAQAEQIRLKSASDAAAARVALAQAKYELESARNTSKQAAADAKTAAAEAAFARLKGTIPPLSEIPMNAITMSDGTVFRQAEVSNVAIDRAVEALIAELGSISSWSPRSTSQLLITSDADLAWSTAAYHQLKGEMSGLIAAERTIASRGRKLLQTVPDETDKPRRRGLVLGSPAVLASIGEAAAAGIMQVASLFETETAVSGIGRPTGDRTVQLKVAHRLLASDSSLEVTLENMSIGSSTSPLMKQSEQLRKAGIALDALAARLAKRIAALPGDKNAGTRVPLEDLAADAEALSLRVTGLFGRMTTIGEGQSISVLGHALTKEPLITAGERVAVLVLPSVQVAVDQVIVRRRLFSAQAAVLAYVELEYSLLKGGRLVRAGTVSGSATSRTKFARDKLQITPDPPTSKQS